MWSLPNDVLIEIVGNWLDFESFSNLDIAFTNKALRLEYLRLISSNEFVFSGDTVDFIRPYALNWLMSRHIKVGKIKLGARHNKIVELLPLMLSRLNSLLWNASMNESEFVDILNQCTSLTELETVNISNVNGWNWKFGPTLTILYMYDATITSDDLIAIGENCVHLRDLMLMRCDCEERTAYPLHENHFEKLEKVRFSDVGVNSIEYIIQKATNLVSILVDRDIALLLAKYCCNIASFYCRGEGSDVNDNSLTKFFKQSPQLKCLELNVKSYEVSDNCLQTLSETCTNIVELHIDCADTQLEWYGSFLKKLTKLRYISIYSEGALECAIQYCCPSVEAIDIMDNSQLNKIPRAFPNLRRLFVEDERYCNDLIVKLARYCPKLEYVDLFMVRDITDESAIALVQNCPMLNCLKLWSALHITNKIVTAIVKYGNNLTELALRGDKLTAAAYLALCEGCPLLRKITFCSSHDLPYDVSVHEAIKKLREVRRVTSYLGPDEYNQ